MCSFEIVIFSTNIEFIAKHQQKDQNWKIMIRTYEAEGKKEIAAIDEESRKLEKTLNKLIK